MFFNLSLWKCNINNSTVYWWSAASAYKFNQSSAKGQKPLLPVRFPLKGEAPLQMIQALQALEGLLLQPLCLLGLSIDPDWGGVFWEREGSSWSSQAPLHVWPHSAPHGPLFYRIGNRGELNMVWIPLKRLKKKNNILWCMKMMMCP